MDDLTGFQRDLLVVTAGLDEPNGLEIKEKLEQYYESDINHGHLYPNLDELVDKALLEKGKQDERTNAYVVTHRGDRELRARRTWENRYVREVVAELDDEQAMAAD